METFVHGVENECLPLYQTHSSRGMERSNFAQRNVSFYLVIMYDVYLSCRLISLFVEKLSLTDNLFTFAFTLKLLKFMEISLI